MFVLLFCRYMYLGITLARLDDFENACSAYEKAINMYTHTHTTHTQTSKKTNKSKNKRKHNTQHRESDHLFELNYSITLYNHGEVESATTHFKVCLSALCLSVVCCVFVCCLFFVAVVCVSSFLRVSVCCLFPCCLCLLCVV